MARISVIGCDMKYARLSRKKRLHIFCIYTCKRVYLLLHLQWYVRDKNVVAIFLDD